MSIRREREKQAFQLILKAGDEGFLQVKMCRRLGINGRDGSRVARGLEEKGVIKRQRELHEGRWTYRLISLRKPITINSISDCPCMVCGDIDRCLPGLQIKPSLCTRLTYWMTPNKG